MAVAYTIDFTAIVLAPSFSPLRYVGLAVQLASIFFVFRGSARRRGVAILLTIAASFFWNTEFAVLGSFGQGLALLSPRLSLSHFERFLFLGVAIVIAAAFVLGHGVSPDITSTVQLGFLNIGVPLMTVTAALIFFRNVLIGQTAFAWAAFQFPDGERDARLCLLFAVALVLIKYLYNPSPPHLSFVGILLVPMALVFFPWNKTARSSASAQGLRWIGRAVVTSFALGFCLWAGQLYLQMGAKFRTLFVDDFSAKSWTHLGETIGMIAPEGPIAERVAAIRAEIKPGEKILMLSPFDHLLSFYINPRAFCGHFDVLTNVATSAQVQSLLSCAQRSPNVLIVYDSALERPCPDLESSVLHTATRCPKKLIIKRNMQMLMERLRPSVTVVGTSSDLTFYRPQTTGPNPPAQTTPPRAPAASSSGF